MRISDWSSDVCSSDLYNQEPWIELSGDDRTGAVTGGETIRVNGRFFDRVKRIAVFALIYDGVPNWNKTDGVVRMNIPGQPEIEVRIEEGRDNCRLCGIALIDNEGGPLSMTRHLKIYEGQQTERAWCRRRGCKNRK